MDLFICMPAEILYRIDACLLWAQAGSRQGRLAAFLILN
jgi:hypothetical protein